MVSEDISHEVPVRATSPAPPRHEPRPCHMGFAPRSHTPVRLIRHHRRRRSDGHHAPDLPILPARPGPPRRGVPILHRTGPRRDLRRRGRALGLPGDGQHPGHADPCGLRGPRRAHSVRGRRRPDRGRPGPGLGQRDRERTRLRALARPCPAGVDDRACGRADHLGPAQRHDVRLRPRRRPIRRGPGARGCPGDGCAVRALRGRSPGQAGRRRGDRLRGPRRRG
jgi:hypothetical protein